MFLVGLATGFFVAAFGHFVVGLLPNKEIEVPKAVILAYCLFVGGSVLFLVVQGYGNLIVGAVIGAAVYTLLHIALSE